MKNIIIVTNYFPPESVGRASRIFELVKNLKKFHNVLVISPPPTFPFGKFKKAEYLYRNENFDDLNVLRLWTFQPSDIVPSFLQRAAYYLIFPLFCSLYLIFRSRKISSVIVSTPPPSVLLVTLVVRFLRKKLIVDIGDLWDTTGPTSNYLLLRKIMRWFEVSCWKKSDVIVSNQMAILEKIRNILQDKCSAKLFYLPYLVDTNTFKKQKVEQENQLIYTGNYGPILNFHSIIKAMPTVLSKMPDLKLQFYGGGEYETELKKLVRDLKLENNCIFNNPVHRSEIPILLSKSLMGIIPLSMNGIHRFAKPTKIYEYLSCGLPLFAYGVSDEVENIVKESKAGVFLRTSDEEKIAEELIKVLPDKKLLNNFSLNGQKFIERQTSISGLEDLL